MPHKLASTLYVTILGEKSNLFYNKGIAQKCYNYLFFHLYYHSSSSLSDVLLNFAFIEKKRITHHIVSNHHTRIISTIFNRKGNPLFHAGFVSFFQLSKFFSIVESKVEPHLFVYVDML